MNFLLIFHQDLRILGWYKHTYLQPNILLPLWWHRKYFRVVLSQQILTSVSTGTLVTFQVCYRKTRQCALCNNVHYGNKFYCFFSKARAFGFGLLCSLLKMFFGDCCFPERNYVLEKLPKNQENSPGLNNTLLNFLF